MVEFDWKKELVEELKVEIIEIAETAEIAETVGVEWEFEIVVFEWMMEWD